MNQEKIGKFIIELRKEKKWTQEDLAQKLLVDRTTVSKWERGLYIPNADVLLQLQELFNVSINEILFGERRNTKNDKKIDNIPIELIKDHKRKIKKILFSSAIVTILLIFAFLAYYFFSNYNSINIYRIFGENENLSINDGIMIASREKSYIKIGKIKENDGNSIIKTRLYFIRNNKEYNIFTGDKNDTESLYINTFNYNELFTYKDIKYIISGLFLEVTLEDGEKQLLNLKVERDFSNNSIFNKHRLAPVSDSTNMDLKENVPEYIQKNFTLNKKDNEYYYEKGYNEYKEIQKYLYNINLFMISKIYNDYEEYFEYSMDDYSLTHYLIKNNKIEDNFVYDISKKTCKIGECSQDIIDNFINNYFSKISK